MAVQNSIDPPSRSQDFYIDLYQCFKTTPINWYIKDAEHRFVDASALFIKNFFPSSLKSPVSFPASDYKLFTRNQRSVLHEVESLALDTGAERHYFTSRLFKDACSSTSFFLMVIAVLFNNEICTLNVVRALNDSYEDISLVTQSVFLRNNPDINDLSLECAENVPSVNIDIEDFRDVDPLDYISHKQWEVAWFLICGATMSEISRILGISHQAVTKRARNMYHKLRVFDAEGLKYVARHYSWVDKAPFESDGFLIEINKKNSKVG